MRLVPTDHYIQMVKWVQRLLQKNISVFVATDDQRAIRMFRSFAEESGIELFILKYPYRTESYYPRLAKRGVAAAVYAIADVYLCAMGNWFMGTFQSNIDRWIMEVRSAQLGLASHPYFEVGGEPCVTTAQCMLINRRFDFGPS
jgi:hypothetical protein